jgi:pimeloyl-ACP methyl ester carboxylesterase/ferredoxin
MARITFVTNANKVVEAADGGTLLHASLRHQGGIPFKCAGGKCGTCRCHVDAGRENLGPVNAKERTHLTDDEFADGWRMACQAIVKGGEVSVSWIPLADRKPSPKPAVGTVSRSVPVASAATFVPAASAAPAGESPAHTPRARAPFVLVHGAWHGGWCWKKVRTRLAAAGHDVFAPSLTGLGERAHLATPAVDLDTHVEDVVSLLEAEDLRGVILVGHSYAGMVITGVVARVPERIDQVVYLDAFLPEDGRCLNDYSIGAPGYADNVRANGEGWRLPFEGTLTLEALGVTDPADVAWMASRLRDQPYATFTQPVRLGAQWPGPARPVYVLSSERKHYLEAAERAAAKGFHLLRIPGAGHDAMVTRPGEVADALLSLTSR